MSEDKYERDLREHGPTYAIMEQSSLMFREWRSLHPDDERGMDEIVDDPEFKSWVESAAR